MDRQRSPCAYILASRPRGTLYVGVTSNLIGRLGQHRGTEAPGFTQRYAVKRLVWFELHPDMAGAIAREKQLKNWHRSWKLNLIEAANAHWIDLAVGLGFPPLAPGIGRDGP